MIKSRGTLRIGTSGIVVPGSKETFPAEFQLKSRLNYYSSLFNTLEVNSTFHKLPMTTTLQKWSEDVGDAFQFTVKLWREITHVKHLDFNPENLDVFLRTLENIGNKKGCLLIQFPGSITVEYIDKVEQILLSLQRLDSKNIWRKAIEFRSLTWYGSNTFDLLSQYNASIVLHDMPKSRNLELNLDSKFMYYRFHGIKGDYRGSYSDEFLEEQSNKIRNCLKDGKDVYGYFNNTMGDAFNNAMTLKAMVEK